MKGNPIRVISTAERNDTIRGNVFSSIILVSLSIASVFPEDEDVLIVGL